LIYEINAGQKPRS